MSLWPQQYLSTDIKGINGARFYLRSLAVKNSKTYSLGMLKYLKGTGEDDAFLKLYQNAVNWAETQKPKSAEELYALYEELDFPQEPVLNHVKAGLSRAYLQLAAEKGSVQVKEELELQSRKVKELMEKQDTKER